MGTQKQREIKEKNMRVGGILPWNCAVKLLTTLFLFLCSYATFIHFLPSTNFSPSHSISISDLRLLCFSTKQPPPPPPNQDDEILNGGTVLKRSLTPYGAAAYTFILMSAYRGGLNTFAVIGLSSKPLHLFSKPSYLCLWLPSGSSTAEDPVTTGRIILPDWGFGRVYTAVVINCTFPAPIDSGGKLLVVASTNGGGDKNLNLNDTMEALVEKTDSKALNASYYFTDPPKYEYLYCGSPLFGNISPQRIREWLAYHVRLLGTRSHFVMYDAGGVHEEVMEVLRPWMEKGFVSLHDVREQERFDGHYHNQFLILNDCLHRHRFDAKWMFFFDVDEFIYVDRKNTSIESITESLSGYTQFFIHQTLMASTLCLSEDKDSSHSKWGFEKLVCRDVKKVKMNHKYAVQPRNVFATGVHLTKNLAGKSTYKMEGLIKYFHYHGVLAERRDPCRQFHNATTITVDGNPCIMENTMRRIAGNVKRFELDMIGPRLQGTRP